MKSARIDFLDYVRGVALLGILLMNIQSFGDIAAVYLNPIAAGPLAGPDLLVWAIVRLLADQKFLALFAMLFGAGLVLFMEGAEARGQDASRLLRRRMGWLMVFGVLHATLVWHGDVLFCYGACGLLVVGARRWAPRRLVRTAVGVSVVGSSLWLLGGITFPWWPPGMVAALAPSWMPDAAARLAESSAYRAGWLDQMSFRLPQALENELGGLLFAMGWKAASLMLVGMALYRLEILTGRAPRSTYRALAGWGLGVGLPLTVAGMAVDGYTHWNVAASFFLGSQIHGWGSYGVALGWLGLLGLWRGHVLEAPLAAVGRMAFSNYILHSVVGTWIFYGHGLGLFGTLGRTGQLGVVAGLWSLNLILSPLWLRHFQQGPLEWVWRSLVRRRMEPFRRREGPTSG